MRYCRQCLQVDTRPGQIFLDDGRCVACVYYTSAASVDYAVRVELLREKIAEHRQRNSNTQFDCVIGVSGGKDSTRQALWARDYLGMRPLLACFAYPPQQISDVGAANLSNLIDLGFDVVVGSMGPQTWRDILRAGFLAFENWARASELAIIAFSPRVAIDYGISLILHGENPALQLGDGATMGKTEYSGENLKYMNTVAGGDVTWLDKRGVSTNSRFLNYPSMKEFDDRGIEIIYLGWFWPDWGLTTNGLHSLVNGLTLRTAGCVDTGDWTHVTSLDEDWVTLNQMIKYYKYGFGRVSDYVNEAIRRGEITRAEGISLVESYDGACAPEYIKSFSEYIGISVEDFWRQVNRGLNRDLFSGTAPTSVRPLFRVGHGL